LSKESQKAVKKLSIFLQQQVQLCNGAIVKKGNGAIKKSEWFGEEEQCCKSKTVNGPENKNKKKIMGLIHLPNLLVKILIDN
jgi:hypothetical protein